MRVTCVGHVTVWVTTVWVTSAWDTRLCGSRDSMEGTWSPWKEAAFGGPFLNDTRPSRTEPRASCARNIAAKESPDADEKSMIAVKP